MCYTFEQSIAKYFTDFVISAESAVYNIQHALLN